MNPRFNPASIRDTVENLSQPDVYHFGPENLLLADLLALHSPGPHVLDLGCGCGVLGIVAALATQARQLTLVDLQPEMMHHAGANAPLADCPVNPLTADIRSVTLAEPADLVVMNPPFFAAGAGRESSNVVAARATHAHAGGVADFVQAAARLLSPAGAVWLVYPADGLADALNAAAAVSLFPAHLQIVHARHRDRPFRVWLRLTWSPRPMQVVSCSTWTRR
jgi:tRNA1Val (adenine37-N6)-methyltransferase